MFGHIIVDGPDAVGKTTLAKYINDKYSFKVVHNGADRKNDYDYYHELITSNNHDFYDRFMAGEFVYPKIYNREPKLSWSDIGYLCDDIINTNSLYIIMNCSNKDILLNRLAERGEFNYFNEIEQQIDLFRSFASILEKPFFEKYDNFRYVDISEPDSYDKLYSIIDEFIKNNKQGELF